MQDEVIIAYEMNGEDIPRDHGYPMRLIAPGKHFRNFSMRSSITYIIMLIVKLFFLQSFIPNK